MKWNGSLCVAPQVTFHMWRRCQHLHCVTWSHASLKRELRGWTSLGNVGMWKAVSGQLLQWKSPARRDWKKSQCMKRMMRTWMMRMQTRRVRALAALDPCKKALTLPAATLTGAAALIAGLSRASQGTGRMVPLGDSLQVRTVEAKGKKQSWVSTSMPFPPLHEQESSSESPEVAGQAAPGEAMSMWVTSCQQAARMQSSSTLQRIN